MTKGFLRRGIRKVLVGTSNRHKLAEYRRLLRRVASDELAVRCWSDLCADIVVDEDGETLADNATKKGIAAAVATGCWTLADDTGLFVPLLNGEPGVRSGRYAADHASQFADDGAPLANKVSGTSSANRDLLLQKLRACAEFQRQGRAAAEFRCVMVLADPQGDIVGQGVAACRGWIVAEPRGDGGFGYDTLFHLPELGVRLAELGPVATDMIGHRGRAFARLHRSL